MPSAVPEIKDLFNAARDNDLEALHSAMKGIWTDRKAFWPWILDSTGENNPKEGDMAAIHVAAQNSVNGSHIRILEALLFHGAKVNLLTTGVGRLLQKTPLDLTNDPETIGFLESCGAVRTAPPGPSC